MGMDRDWDDSEYRWWDLNQLKDVLWLDPIISVCWLEPTELQRGLSNGMSRIESEELLHCVKNNGERIRMLLSAKTPEEFLMLSCEYVMDLRKDEYSFSRIKEWDGCYQVTRDGMRYSLTKNGTIIA